MFIRCRRYIFFIVYVIYLKDAVVTETKIVCETPPLPNGWYNVVVAVPSTEGTLVSTCAQDYECYLDVSIWYTPKL